ncbi:MAG: hypothetical protein U0892_23070 [Pirellulales bacterium]
MSNAFHLRRLFVFVGLCSVLSIGLVSVGCSGSGEPSGTASGGGGGKVKRVILLTNGDDPFWDAMRKGMEKAEKDFDLASSKLRVEMDKNDGTSKGQIDKLKDYASQTDIAAVAVSVTDAESVALADAMQELRKQGRRQDHDRSRR